MAQKTLTRTEICESLCNKVGLSRQQSINVLESTLKEISNGLKQEGNVKISSFVTFHVRQKSKRIGRNPKTGQEVMITPRRSLSFRASHILKDVVNSQAS